MKNPVRAKKLGFPFSQQVLGHSRFLLCFRSHRLCLEKRKSRWCEGSRIIGGKGFCGIIALPIASVNRKLNEGPQGTVINWETSVLGAT